MIWSWDGPPEWACLSRSRQDSAPVASCHLILNGLHGLYVKSRQVAPGEVPCTAGPFWGPVERGLLVFHVLRICEAANPDVLVVVLIHPRPLDLDTELLLQRDNGPGVEIDPWLYHAPINGIDAELAGFAGPSPQTVTRHIKGRFHCLDDRPRYMTARMVHCSVPFRRPVERVLLGLHVLRVDTVLSSTTDS